MTERIVGKLGKLPAGPPAAFKFASYFNAEALPAPPKHFGHYGLIRESTWGMLGNDSVGCCVFSGAGHETMMWSLEGDRLLASFDVANILSDYAAVTGYSPNDPLSDRGTSLDAAADYRRKTGIVDASGRRHKVDAYVALKLQDWGQLRLATWLFGAVGVGIIVTTSVESDFRAGRPWDHVSGPQIGGHYVPCVGFNSRGQGIFVTWGGLQGMTQQFYNQMADEALAYVSLETLSNKGLSPEGFDRAKLLADLAQLGS